MKLTVVVGNPQPASRTLKVAEALAQRIERATRSRLTETIDLCEYGPHLFEWNHDGLSALTRTVADSDIAVIASPTYKAAYTGMLKAFLDRYPTDGLAGVTAVPVMTGGSPAHSMAVDTTLRTVLVELGASVPTRGLYFETSRMDELSAVLDAWTEQNLTLPTFPGPLTRGEH